MRLEGWEQRLAELIGDAQVRAFQYGEWDCALFACEAIAVCTGDNPNRAFLGYAGDAGCAAVLHEHGGLRAIADRVATERGFRHIPVLMAQRGDVVLGVHDGRETLGVCIGASVAFAVQPRGLARIPITDPSLTVAWRIA